MSDALEFTACKNWKPEDTNKFIIDGKVLILRVGKWRVKVVTIVSDEEFEAKGLTCPGLKEDEGKKGEEEGEERVSPKQGKGGNEDKVSISEKKRLDRPFGRLLEGMKGKKEGPRDKGEPLKRGIV